ncbi:MAG: DUF2203 family protein [Acidobacteria bacterium]|nr:DUF2203 family protein [Acidobacteriota bacterium]
MPRYFNLAQAEAMLPRVEAHIRQAVHLKTESGKSEEDLREFLSRVQMMGGMIVDRKKVLGLQARRDAILSRLKEIIEEVHEWGCQIKDLDTGLCDFPTLYRGEEVYLCWRLGETAIEYWHEVHAGFRGRKPIDEEFKRNHRGDLLD